MIVFFFCHTTRMTTLGDYMMKNTSPSRAAYDILGIHETWSCDGDRSLLKLDPYGYISKSILSDLTKEEEDRSILWSPYAFIRVGGDISMLDDKALKEARIYLCKTCTKYNTFKEAIDWFISDECKPQTMTTVTAIVCVFVNVFNANASILAPLMHLSEIHLVELNIMIRQFAYISDGLCLMRLPNAFNCFINNMHPAQITYEQHPLDGDEWKLDNLRTRFMLSMRNQTKESKMDEIYYLIEAIKYEAIIYNQSHRSILGKIFSRSRKSIESFFAKVFNEVKIIMLSN